MKYFLFHKSHYHTTNDFIQLKGAIKGLVKRGHLSEYIRGDKRDKEECMKKKSPFQILGVITTTKNIFYLERKRNFTLVTYAK